MSWEVKSVFVTLVCVCSAVRHCLLLSRDAMELRPRQTALCEFEDFRKRPFDEEGKKISTPAKL